MINIEKKERTAKLVVSFKLTELDVSRHGDIRVKVIKTELQMNLTLTRMKPLKREPFHYSFMISMSLNFMISQFDGLTQSRSAGSLG